MIDLEMNKVPKAERVKGGIHNEVIEIGAVKMNDNFEIIDKYQTYVFPEHGKMDRMIIRLTHITDEMLVGAPLYDEAMSAFLDWIGEEDVTFYSWSMADIRQLRHESSIKKCHLDDVEKMEKSWVDFQEEFSRLLHIKNRIKLKDAVASADYVFTGDEHTALSDAVNTAEILILTKHEEEFKRVMKPVLELFTEDNTGSSLGSMCEDFFANYKVEE
jgi:inhibitor of KinA sporulation pathway (predicted exonuclease)